MASPKARDQGFTNFGAKLETRAAPFNPFADKSDPNRGDPKDYATYAARPGVDFMRPWIAIRNGPAFQWPLGLQGWENTIDPKIGVHTFIGDNAVQIDVLHAGEEHFTMNGSFPGKSGPALIRALKDVVYRQAKDNEGKILYIPEIFTYAQRVQVVRFSSTRSDEDRDRDSSYSIDFVRIGTTNFKTVGIVPDTSGTTAKKPKGKSSRSVETTSKYNTLRKVAAWKLNDANKWDDIYKLNESYFTKKKIPRSQAPSYQLPPGTKVYF